MDGFVAELSATLAAETVQGAAHGHDVAAVLEREHRELGALYDRIGAETSAEALFGL